MTQKFEGAPTLGRMKYVIYVLVIAIVVAVAVMLVDNFFPFLPVNPISGPSAAARAGKVFWRSVTADSENLIVPASESPTVVAGAYTMSVQLMIGDSRTPSLGRFRHIVHRGSNPCGLSATKSGPTGHAGIQIGDLASDYKSDPQYVMTGLPEVMNPGLFLDKYRNDLHVFIHTKGKEDSMDVLWLESLTVEDLPLGTPITIGVVCNGRTVEVYLNCRLYSTLLLKGTPYLPKADNQWFGRYCAFPMSGLVKNLELWGTPLGATDYIQMCRGASFDKNDLPSTCPTSGSTKPVVAPNNDSGDGMQGSDETKAANYRKLTHGCISPAEVNYMERKGFNVLGWRRCTNMENSTVRAYFPSNNSYKNVV